MSSPAAEGQRVIGRRYRLIARIGSGGMGTVWRAHDDVLGRTVAVKEVDLPPQLPARDRAELRERTMREARAAARLSHPNAVTVHDVIEEDGQPWIVMQLVDADSLSDVVGSSGPLPWRRVAEIGLAVLSALEAAHSVGILHRDVKPANVLLGRDGRVILTDFGVATVEGDPALTGTGLLLGSPAYIAPERALGKGTGTGSDLWSLGATLYTAVEGQPPYDRETPMATLAALATESPPAPRTAGPLTAVLDGLLQRDPTLRLDAPGARRLLEQALAEPADRAAATVFSPGPDRAVGPGAPDATKIVPLPDVSDTDAGTAPSRSRRGRILATLFLVVALGIAITIAAANRGDLFRPAPQPSAQSSKPAVASLPAAFLGRWSGDITETGGSKVATVDLQLYAGAVGSLVGTSSYPKLGCSGELRLVSVTAGERSVRLVETILVQPTPSRCTPIVNIDLEKLEKTLAFSGSDGFAGKLSPGEPAG